MCGRYALPIGPETLTEWFARQNIEVERVVYAEKRSQHQYNIGPTSYVPVFIKERVKQEDSKEKGRSEKGKLEYMRWGFVPDWSVGKDAKNPYSMFNARFENLMTNRTWKGNLSHRCAIPVSGYYEWKHDKKKVPYYVKRKNDELMFLAGIYHHNPKPREGNNLGDECTGSFTIITNDAPEWLSWLHGRMPVVLNPADAGFNKWLDGSMELNEILKPDNHPEQFVWYRVDPALGDSRKDNKKFIQPWHDPLLKFFIKKEPKSPLVSDIPSKSEMGDLANNSKDNLGPSTTRVKREKEEDEAEAEVEEKRNKRARK